VSRIAGTLVAVLDEGQAWVTCHPAGSGCDHCANGIGCAAERRAKANSCLLVELPGPHERPERGAPVTLEVDDDALLRLARRMYLPPLAGLLLGPAVVRAAEVPGEAWQAGAAVMGFIAGALIARLWTRGPIRLQARRRRAADVVAAMAGRR
jgi:positive regulator of sigma E activity